MRFPTVEEIIALADGKPTPTESPKVEDIGVKEVTSAAEGKGVGTGDPLAGILTYEEGKKRADAIITYYNKLSPEARLELVRGLRAKMQEATYRNGAPLIPSDGKFAPIEFSGVTFAFQAIVKGEELKDGNATNTFEEFSTFKSNIGGKVRMHPDGRYGPITHGVTFAQFDKLEALVATGGTIPHYSVEERSVAKGKAEGKGKGGKSSVENATDLANGKSGGETDAERAAREAREREAAEKAKADAAAAKAAEDAKKKANRASPEDLDKYTFKRAQVQYFERVIKENKTAAGFTTEQLEGITKAVREYAFDADGNVKKTSEDGRKFDIKNDIVQQQLRSKVYEKTKALGVSEADIEKLSFTLDKNERTRTIVGGFTAAENAMVRADEALSKQAEKIKAHVESSDNKAYLEGKGISIEKVVDLKSDVAEDKRGVYFKTNFVPPLQSLAEKERVEITKEYAEKIDNEKAKLLKYDVLQRIVNAGYPQLVEVQKVDEKGGLVFKDKVKVDYNAQGDEVRTTTKVPVMDEVKQPDAKDIRPIEPNLNDRATKEAMLAAGLIDENGAFKTLSYTVKVNGVEEARTVAADVALKDPKQYSVAIKSALDTVYAFTEEEVKANKEGGAYLDRFIVTKKVGKQQEEEKIAVEKEVTRLEKERDVKIENSPSNVMLRDSYLADDSDRIKQGKMAKSVLGKYEEANNLYKMAAQYETERQIDELSMDGTTRKERKGQKQAANDIEEFLAKRVAAAEKEVKELEKAEKAEKDETKKQALTDKLASAKETLKALNPLKDQKIDHSKSFDTKDRVDIINVNLGGQDLIHVDAVTKKELAKKQADLKAEAEKDEEGKLGVTGNDKEGVGKNKKGVDEEKTPSKSTQQVLDQSKAKTQETLAGISEEVQKLLADINTHVGALREPASALDNGFSGEKAQKEAKKSWNKAVGELEDDLKELKKLNAKDKESGTAFDTAMEATLNKARDAGVVVTDKFEVDEKQTIQNFKDKSEKQQR